MLYWITSIASLIGVYWSGTHAVWTHVDLKHAIYPQAALQSIYFLMAVYGICTWSRCRIKSKKKVIKIKE